MACGWAISGVSLITWHTDKPLLMSHSQTCQLKQVKAIETWTYVNMCEIRGWHKLISEAAMKPVHNMDHTTTPGNWLVTNWQQQHSITQLILIWLSKNTYSFLSTFRLSNRTQKITRIFTLYQALTSGNFLKHIPKLTIFGTHNLQTMHHTLINKLLHIMQFFLFNIRPKLHHLKWRKLCVTLPVNMAPFSKEEKIVINFITSSAACWCCSSSNLYLETLLQTAKHCNLYIHADFKILSSLLSGLKQRQNSCYFWCLVWKMKSW